MTHERPPEKGEEGYGLYQWIKSECESQQVREMTVEEAEEYIYAETRRFTETSSLIALAKLGTIRIVGDV